VRKIPSSMLKAYAVFIFALLASFAGAQAYQPILQPHQYYPNLVGAPCAGCSLYTYAAGTTTPLATYTDATGGSQNTNPVILDASGSAAVWVGTSSYKFALLDTNGTTLWTVDQVTSNVQLLSGTGTAGYLAKWGTSTGLGFAPADYGVTAVNEFTFSAPVVFVSPVTVSGTSDFTGAVTLPNGEVISSTTPLAAAGITTLVAGTTPTPIPTALACVPSATCIYKLTNCGLNASSAVGTLSLGTVVAGTSFVVNSESATATIVTGDLSTVCWQVN
jgi:hypothetical protein